MPKYMRPQVINHDDKIRFACNGDRQAETFCVAYLQFLNTLDDLFDKDKEVAPRLLSYTFFELINNLSNNPFWVANKGHLLPVILQASTAWVDSEELAKSADPELKVASEVLKGYYGEVLYQIAYLTGGMDHMLNCSAKYRGFDFEEK